MKKILILLVNATVTVGLVSIHYFIVTNQYIAGSTVSWFWVITSIYLIWLIALMAISNIRSKFTPFFVFISIAPILSILTGDIMILASVAITLIFALAFETWKRIAAKLDVLRVDGPLN